MGRRTIPQETVDAICSDYRAGEKLVVIALTHGVSEKTVQNIREREGIPLRRRLDRSCKSHSALGRAAFRAGMTVADIENWARSRGGDAHA